MRRTLAIILFYLSATNSSAQNLESALWPELEIYSLFTEKALEIINEASNLEAGILKQSQQLQTFSSNKECLGSLQLLSMGAAVVANIMPFSSVHLKEDKVGPIGRYRLLLNGEKVHFSAFCEEASLRVEVLDWEDLNVSGYTAFKQETFDAAVGAILLAYLQGIFDDEADTNVFQNNETNESLESVLDSALETPETSESVTSPEKQP